MQALTPPYPGLSKEQQTGSQSACFPHPARLHLMLHPSRYGAWCTFRSEVGTLRNIIAVCNFSSGHPPIDFPSRAVGGPSRPTQLKHRRRKLHGGSSEEATTPLGHPGCSKAESLWLALACEIRCVRLQLGSRNQTFRLVVIL